MKTQPDSQASAIRRLAKSAKERLKNSNYKGEDVGSIGSNITNFIRPKAGFYNSQIIIKTIDCNEDQEFCKKVQQLLGQEQIINPLSYIIDKEYMETLDQIDRQRYIFDLSEKYNRVRENYINNQIAMSY